MPCRYAKHSCNFKNVDGAKIVIFKYRYRGQLGFAKWKMSFIIVTHVQSNEHGSSEDSKLMEVADMLISEYTV